MIFGMKILSKFKGEKPEAFNGDNKETFSSVDEKTWPETIQQLDKVLTEIEKAVEAAGENKLKEWYRPSLI